MPLTADGIKILESMKKRYGDEKGEKVFYATMNTGKKGTEKWHKKNKRKGLADL